MKDHNPNTIDAFIDKWAASGAAERANAQSFILDLCQLLEVGPPRPKTPEEAANAYVFEKTVPTIAGSSKNFIDCYKRGHFVLEAKQGADAANGSAPLSAAAEAQRAGRKRGHGIRGTKAWDTAMEKARKQAEKYARLLPREEIDGGRPPFLMVVDVGHSIALYTDWSRAGGHYVPFPDPASYRIRLEGLRKEENQALLRTVWTDPLSLDPSRRSTKVTRKIADRLARLARSLEGQHSPERVANFLMRCLFTMFAEDVELLPEKSFTRLLGDLQKAPGTFVPMLESLWGSMDKGGFSVVLRKNLPRFNGGLFAEIDVIDLDADQIQLLLEAADSDWRDVEPAIFGTLLERALDPQERHKLGAHYTPRAYVERLVQPTIIEPLRAEWEAVQVAALQLAEQGDLTAAIGQVERFLQRLANLKVLDPACGSGNFLYVTLELLKRLEGEVFNTLRELGQGQQRLELAGAIVTPANLLGIEVNPRAAAIAELVLWIGFLQWHLRSRGSLEDLQEPIIRDLHNIECRDAVLTWEDRTPMLDAAGQPVTHWDGRTTKPHPITGEEVPDESARISVYEYLNPKPAEWPVADFIVGNPPFIGEKRLRDSIGDGYVDAIRHSFSELPACDLVMYWWHKAATLVLDQKLKRFGLITTNSITQTKNRQIIEKHLQVGLKINLAIPDHPWVDSTDGAAVRIAMTIASCDQIIGELWKVIKETENNDDDGLKVQFAIQRGVIHSNLQVGAAINKAVPLKSNKDLVYQGVKLVGAGFIVTLSDRTNWLQENPNWKQFLPQLISGSDLTKAREPRYCIDFFSMSASEAMKVFPPGYQKVMTDVKPFRDNNKDKFFRKNWWVFGRTRGEMRAAVHVLNRYIATSEVSKHRFFLFLTSEETIPDGSVAVVASNDAFILGALSSHIHVTWALAQGGRMGIGNDPRWQNGPCFENFPFPSPSREQKSHIRSLGERLDAHRKRQQELHPDLTMTDLYNVLEKERAGQPLTEKERRIHEQGLVGILRQLHDELDAAVAAAYGWPADLEESEILDRLVQLNAERAAEEAAGHVRWLRPEYQAPEEARAAKQGKLLEVDIDTAEAQIATTEKRPWPDSLPEQAAALRDLLNSLDAPADVPAIAAAFQKKRTKQHLEQVQRLLETLGALGQAEEVGEGVWGR
ncbi:MAG: class I SAM-dependent DNA methyltransferase [Lewinellaceae bacterium]|nr:class I SAM-dependent DNA methyltransferase [Phaeodactylibacter sp.]MCB9039132.1 class I SAM-dependent DNA methyltransferase [Lewinellaceae bacterium]